MNSCSPEPDDALLAQWTFGSPEQRENVFKVAWQRYRNQLLAMLMGSFSGTSWQDCEDFVDDAYCILWKKLSQGQFVWKGKNSLINFLCEVGRNNAIDFIRKRERRMGLEAEIQAGEEERAPEAPDAWMQRTEWEMLRKSRYDQATERLLACVQRMKRAQRSVGVVMADCWVTNSRWPSNERILEVLRQTEPELKLATVIERRKEVVAKFRPILEGTMPDRLTPLTPAPKENSQESATNTTSNPVPPQGNAPLSDEAAAWAATPIEEHIARWKFEMAEGLRDADGRWVAEPNRRRRFATKPKPGDDHA